MNMRMLKPVAMAALLAVAPPGALAERTSKGPVQGGYSVAPLRNPIFDPAKVVVETKALNSWLGSNIRTLSYEQMKGPRERLYYLIDSRVKQLYAEEKQVLPRANDPILEILFSWSEKLKVFGGAYAFNAVRAPNSKRMEPQLKLPAGIRLSLSKDMFTVQSDLGWSVGFPYYFMIWNIGDFTAKGGPRTQLIALSTGAAKDKSRLGHSQATVLFLFSPARAGFESFEEYWRKQLGIDATAKQQPLTVRELQSSHVVDGATKLHKEFTAWSEVSGSYAVAYLGIEGTYEWNRPHFLDFLRSIEAKGDSPPNK